MAKKTSKRSTRKPPSRQPASPKPAAKRSPRPRRSGTSRIRSVEVSPHLSASELARARKEAERTIGFVGADEFSASDGSRSLIARYEYTPGGLPRAATETVGNAAASPTAEGTIEHYTHVPDAERPALRTMIRADGGTVIAEYPDGPGTFTVVARYP